MSLHSLPSSMITKTASSTVWTGSRNHKPITADPVKFSASTETSPGDSVTLTRYLTPFPSSRQVSRSALPCMPAYDRKNNDDKNERKKLFWRITNASMIRTLEAHNSRSSSLSERAVGEGECVWRGKETSYPIVPTKYDALVCTWRADIYGVHSLYAHYAIQIVPHVFPSWDGMCTKAKCFLWDNVIDL